MNAITFNRLLRRIKRDRRAIELIYAEFYPKIVLHLQRRFGSFLCSEDVAEDVFVHLLSFDCSHFIKYPTSWLYAIADDKGEEILHRNNVELPFPKGGFLPAGFEHAVLSADVESAFRHLDEESRTILYLRFWEGYSGEAIARELHISPGNVRVKISRAYKTLKKYL